jgi:hypothetical protein
LSAEVIDEENFAFKTAILLLWEPFSIYRLILYLFILGHFALIFQ